MESRSHPYVHYYHYSNDQRIEIVRSRTRVRAGESLTCARVRSSSWLSNINNVYTMQLEQGTRQRAALMRCVLARGYYIREVSDGDILYVLSSQIDVMNAYTSR